MEGENDQIEVELINQMSDSFIQTTYGDSWESTTQLEFDLKKVFIYLLNVRVIAVILANILWNQIKILIRERVIYDRELFNYEEYQQKGMADSRLIRNVLFMTAKKGSKNLVAEFFKFQKDKLSSISDSTLQLNTSEKLIHNINLISIHVENLYKIDKHSLDIEPILLVFFQQLSNTKKSKDALSKVSKQFFKDLKLKYRELENLSWIMCCILKLFEGHGLLMQSSNWVEEITIDKFIN